MRQQRKLKDNEMLCKHGCKTIVEKAIGSCEMCCEKAIADRLNRVAPLVKEALEKAEARVEKLRALIEQVKDRLPNKKKAK